jgi:hypothetical protein
MSDTFRHARLLNARFQARFYASANVVMDGTDDDDFVTEPAVVKQQQQSRVPVRGPTKAKARAPKPKPARAARESPVSESDSDFEDETEKQEKREKTVAAAPRVFRQLTLPFKRGRSPVDDAVDEVEPPAKIRKVAKQKQQVKSRKVTKPRATTRRFAVDGKPVLPADLEASLTADELRVPVQRGHAVLHKAWLHAVYRPSAGRLRPYTIDPVKGCWLSTRTKTKKGYAGAHIKTKAAPTQMHGFALCYWTGERPVEGSGTQVSHRCNNRVCFRPSHLVIETVRANNARKNCLVQVVCPHCDAVAYECPHVPKCI